MSHSKVVRFAVSTLVAGLASAAVASPPAQSNANNPEGSWLLTVSFPAQGTNPPLSFKEIVTLHAGGTLTETNSTLNAASGVLGFGEGSFGLIGSDGHGTWQRAQSGRIETVFRKMVFCGTAVGLCNQFGKTQGQFFGYLVVRLTATVKGDALVSPLGSSDTNLVVGETPDSPIVIPFGQAEATGTRLR